MNQADQSWLSNRISAAVDDDFYLDREEEKRIKEEASSRGIAISEIEMSVRVELDKAGACCERLLLDELTRLLHQFTDDDKYLDAKEERDALDKVLVPAKGKKVGLDPRVAQEFVDSFCKVNGVKRSDENIFRPRNLVIGAVALAVISISGFFWYKTANTKGSVVSRTVDSAAYTLGAQDREEIDQLVRKATLCVDQGQYTDPPEKSAKACLDQIRSLDPKGQHKGEEIKALVQRIIDQYFVLAAKSFKLGDKDATRKWIERAKLFHASAEIIREKELEFQLVRTENK